MLALLFDIGGAFLIAKHLRRLWLQIPLLILLGIASSITANLLMHLVASDMFPIGEALARGLGGILIHPAVALIAFWLFRRRMPARMPPQRVSAPPSNPVVSGSVEEGTRSGKAERRILIAIAAAIVAMLLFPPFHLRLPNGRIENLGYAFILDPPSKYSGLTGSVDVAMLVAQWFAVLLVGGLAWLLVRRRP